MRENVKTHVNSSSRSKPDPLSSSVHSEWLEGGCSDLAANRDTYVCILGNASWERELRRKCCTPTWRSTASQYLCPALYVVHTTLPHTPGVVRCCLWPRQGFKATVRCADLSLPLNLRRIFCQPRHLRLECSDAVFERVQVGNGEGTPTYIYIYVGSGCKKWLT